MGREDETRLITYRIWDKKVAMMDRIVSDLLPKIEVAPEKLVISSYSK